MFLFCFYPWLNLLNLEIVSREPVFFFKCKIHAPFIIATHFHKASFQIPEKLTATVFVHKQINEKKKNFFLRR